RARQFRQPQTRKIACDLSDQIPFTGRQLAAAERQAATNRYWHLASPGKQAPRLAYRKTQEKSREIFDRLSPIPNGQSPGHRLKPVLKRFRESRSPPTAP